MITPLRAFCLLLASALLLAFLTPASAQDLPMGKWWLMPRVATQLQISPEAAKKLDEAHLASRIRMVDLRGAMERGRIKLDAEMDREPFNDSAARAAFKELEAARSALQAERFDYLVKVRTVLGLENYQKLKTVFRDMRSERRGHMGDGGDSDGDGEPDEGRGMRRGMRGPGMGPGMKPDMGKQPSAQ